jgi:teichuronic acid exporter
MGRDQAALDGRGAAGHCLGGALHGDPSVGKGAATLAGAPPVRGAILKAAVRSVIALVARYALAKLAGIVGSIILARLLLPADFGIFAIANMVMGVVWLMGDFGLGSSLIQKKAEPTRDEIQSIFTFQLGAALVGALVLFAVAPVIGGIYRLSPDSIWLIRFMAIYLVVSIFRSMPAMILSRRVTYSRIAAADLVGAIVYQVVTVLGAWVGLRAWALALGLTASAIAGTALINLLAPWPIGLRWNWRVIRSSLRFGLPFQGGVALAGLELTSATVIVGLVSGTTALGYTNFAITLVSFGTFLPMILLQVAFPAMSRIQGSTKDLARALETILKATTYILAAVYLPLLLFGREVIEVAFSARWLPALPLVSLLAWAWVLRSGFTAALTALNAMGRAGVSFALQAALAAVSWTLVAVLVKARGYPGLAEAWLLVSIPLPIVLLYLRRLIPISVTHAFLRPTAVLVLLFFVFQQVWPPVQGVGGLVFGTGSVIAAVALAAALIERRTLGPIARRLFSSTPVNIESPDAEADRVR